MFFKENNSIIKIAGILVLCLIAIRGSLFAASSEAMKFKNILVVPDPDFGEINASDLKFDDWELSMDISAQGDLFICNTEGHCIYRFNSKGKRLSVFGRKGEGPGDLLYPHDIEILGNYLLVADQSIRCKLTCFDLNGNLVKVYSTRYPVLKIAWISKSIVFYTSIQTRIENKSKKRISCQILFLFDLEKLKEREIAYFEFPAMEILIEVGGRMLNVSLPGHPYGDVHIAATPNHTVLVGCSNEKKIREIDEKGKIVSTYEHSLPIQLFPAELRENYYNSMRIPRADDATINEFRSKIRKQLEFPRLLPFYHSFWMDQQKNLYIFLKKKCIQDCKEECWVFLPGFKLKEKWELEVSKKLIANFESWDSNGFFRVFENKLFLFVEEIMEDDSLIRLVRIALK